VSKSCDNCDKINICFVLRSIEAIIYSPKISVFFDVNFKSGLRRFIARGCIEYKERIDEGPTE